MKKHYLKPSTQVYELKVRSQILSGSGEVPYDQDFGFIPEKNEHQLA